MEKNLELIKKIVNYDFDKQTMIKHWGDESRTFCLTDKTTPLLSPSRIVKIFTEHIFWSIPEENLYNPRIFGKLIHLGLEFHYGTKQKIKYTQQNIPNYLNDNIDLFLRWEEEERQNFLDEVNFSIEKVIKFLNDNNIQVLASEKHISNKVFHGYPDIIGIKDNKPVIIDLKTSRMEYKKNGKNHLQLGVYNDILGNICDTYILYYRRNTRKVELFKIEETHKIVEKVKDFIEFFDVNYDFEGGD